MTLKAETVCADCRGDGSWDHPYNSECPSARTHYGVMCKPSGARELQIPITTNMVAVFNEASRMRNTLLQAGYTDCGGELWKPPLGKPPANLYEHTDDVAVNRFAMAMKNKLAAKREAGANGWENLTPLQLGRMLEEHVRKGDPIDIGNLAMMLFTWHGARNTSPDRPEISDELLSQISCQQGWETCPCGPCRARREILRLRGTLVKS